MNDDIREESLPLPKPRGRPRRTPLPAFVAKTSSNGKDSLGRPKNFAVVIPPSPSAPRLAIVAASTSGKLHTVTARVPVINKTLPVSIQVRVPSFNGPQPGQTDKVSEVDTRSESSEDQLTSHKHSRRPQYSMVAASGLAPSETSLEENSRDPSISSAPSHDPSPYQERPVAKRRKILPDHGATECDVFPKHFNHPGFRGTSSLATLASKKCQTHVQSVEEDEPLDPVDTINVSEEETEREALLRQFQTNPVYEQGNSSNLSSTSSTSFPEQRYHTAPTEADDMLIDPNIIAQRVGFVAPGGLDKVIAQRQDPILSHSSSNKLTTPVKPPLKRTSLTPHFPQAVKFSSQKHNDLPKNHAHHLSPTRTLTVQPKHAAPPMEEQQSSIRILANHLKDYSSGSNLQKDHNAKTQTPSFTQPKKPSYQNFAPTSNITKFFRPKATPSKPSPLARSGSGSESEDPLTRASSSSSLVPTIHGKQPDSRRGSLIIKADTAKNGTPKSEVGTIQRRRHQHDRHGSSHIEIPDSEDDDQAIPTIITNGYPRSLLLSSTTSTVQGSRDRLNSSDDDSDDDMMDDGD